MLRVEGEREGAVGEERFEVRRVHDDEGAVGEMVSERSCEAKRENAPFAKECKSQADGSVVDGEGNGDAVGHRVLCGTIVFSWDK